MSTNNAVQYRLLQPVHYVTDQTKRMAARGWKGYVILVLPFVAVLLFLSLVLNSHAFDTEGIREVSADEQAPYHPVIPTQPITHHDDEATTVLKEVLNEIIIDAAKQFHPNAKDAKDKDIGHLARQTAVLQDLLRIYNRIDSSNPAFDEERHLFESSINELQTLLYPWITAPSREGSATYSTFFDLIHSYTEEAGIVISTGREGGFRWAIHQIVILRGVLNCTLPIEVFYGGDHDLPAQYRSFIEAIPSAFPGTGSIVTVDITKKFADRDETLRFPGGWAMRPFAMLASSFKTVILADADTVFVMDPRVLLEEESYKRFGSVFWHDRKLSPASDETYKWADELLETAKAKDLENIKKEGWFLHQTFYEMESGALIIDKTRNLAGLLMACHLNSFEVRNDITYQKFYGDKESYWYGHALTSTPYHFVPGYSGGIGRITHPKEDGHYNPDKEEICTLQLLHVLESTQEPFWFNNAITEYKGANDAEYIVPEGWIGHNGRWHGGEVRFINEFCVYMPEGRRDDLLGLPEPVNRVTGEFKWRLERAIDLASEYDVLMQRDKLIEISK